MNSGVPQNALRLGQETNEEKVSCLLRIVCQLVLVWRNGQGDAHIFCSDCMLNDGSSCNQIASVDV